MNQSRNIQAMLPESAFGKDWILLAYHAGTVPEIQNTAPIARTIRDTLMSGLQSVGLGDRIPERISGHRPDGSPTTNTHYAIVPLLALHDTRDQPRSVSHIQAFAIVPPATHNATSDPLLLAALKAVSATTDDGQQLLTLYSVGRNNSDTTFNTQLEIITGEARNRYSDLVQPHLAPSTHFATVTPVLLDRHLKKRGAQRTREIEDLVRYACRHAGLPQPSAIETSRTAFFSGVPAAHSTDQGHSVKRWQKPDALASRQLIHIALTFPTPIAGPAIAGAGRFTGLGLMRAFTPL